jgi:hypothetical protein
VRRLREYEHALVNNDIAVMDELFWNSVHTLRYGVTESLLGYAAIQAFRNGRSPEKSGARFVQHGHHHLWSGLCHR